MPNGLALTLPEFDDLGVLTSTAPVVRRAKLVELDESAISRVGAELAAQPPRIPAWDARYHWSDGGPNTVNTTLLLDALNFCFWPERGAERWRLTYQGESLDGYWALAAGLKRAIEDGEFPLWDASFLADISEECAERIFHPPGRSAGRIPLFETRVAHIRELGRVLLERYGGSFGAAVEGAGGDAIALARLVADEFSSFYDVAGYDGNLVRFYKRAQILVGDLYGIFGGCHWGALRRLEQLTAFADYKIPQLLREEGILRYGPGLVDAIDARKPLVAGGALEVEIRAATIWGVELLRRELAAHGVTARAFELDWILWNRAQDRHGMRPYHRVRTPYY